jgi:hypothetical protein
MFGRRRRPPARPEVYDGLRRQILRLDPAEVGIGPTPELPRVWGLLMDLGANSGTATLVALADGTTSMYFSTGGAIIGGGEHPQVASATRRLLQVVEDHLDQMPDRTDLPLPRSGRVVLRVMTYQGNRAADAAEDDLGHRRHPLSEIFHRAHDVIAELRLIDEAAPGPRSGR